MSYDGWLNNEIAYERFSGYEPDPPPEKEWEPDEHLDMEYEDRFYAPDDDFEDIDFGEEEEGEEL